MYLVPAYMTLKIFVKGKFKKPFDAIHPKMTLTKSHFQGPNFLWSQLVSTSQVFTKHCTIYVTYITRPCSMSTTTPMIFCLAI